MIAGNLLPHLKVKATASKAAKAARNGFKYGVLGPLVS